MVMEPFHPTPVSDLAARMADLLRAEDAYEQEKERAIRRCGSESETIDLLARWVVVLGQVAA